MEISKKAEIIQGFYERVKDYPDFEEFIKTNDMGIPLSIAINNGLVKGFTKQGEQVIDETWRDICSHQLRDPDKEYNSIDEIIPTFIDEDDDEEDEA